jgi:hypothetical protein
MTSKYRSAVFLLSLAFLLFAGQPAYSQASEYFFPQVADGASGAIAYSTSFLINNALNRSVSVTIRFVRSNGSAWSIDLRSFDRTELTGHVSTRTFTLVSGESLELFTGAVDPLAVGWANVTSDGPIRVSEVFHVLSLTTGLPITAAAGVLASPTATKFSLFASVSENEPTTGTRTETGFAVINPDDAAANIQAQPFSRTGVLLSTKTINLAAGAHTAIFVSQVFFDVDFGTRFHGLVIFSSNVNVAMVALRQNYGNSDTIATIAVEPISSLGADILYDHEPNGSRATAQVIGALPVEIVGTMNTPLDGSDADFFSLNLAAGRVLFVFALADMIGSPLDDVIQIHDSFGNIVAQVDVFSAGLRDPFIRFTVPTTGTYYVQHGSTGGTSSRNSFYRLYIMVQ